MRAAVLLLALSCPGHAEPARYPEIAPVPTRAEGAGPDITVDDCRAVPVPPKRRKAIVANGGGRRHWPVESYATAITHTKEPNA